MKKPLILLALVLPVIIVLGGIAAFLGWRHYHKRPAVYTVSGGFAVARDGFLLRSKDDADWSEPVAQVTIGTNIYTLRIPRIKAHSDIAVRWADMVSTNGARPSIGSAEPERIRIDALAPYGPITIRWDAKVNGTNPNSIAQRRLSLDEVLQKAHPEAH